MQALILDDDPAYQLRVARALAGQGFQTICVDTVNAAETALRLGMVDLVILAEMVRGGMTHSLLQLVDCPRDDVPAIVITDRNGEEAADLFDIFPCLYSVMERETDLATMAEVAAGAVAVPAPMTAPEPAPGLGMAAPGMQAAVVPAPVPDALASEAIPARRALPSFLSAPVAASVVAPAVPAAPVLNSPGARGQILIDPPPASPREQRSWRPLVTEASVPDFGRQSRPAVTMAERASGLQRTPTLRGSVLSAEIEGGSAPRRSGGAVGLAAALAHLPPIKARRLHLS